MENFVEIVSSTKNGHVYVASPFRLSSNEMFGEELGFGVLWLMWTNSRDWFARLALVLNKEQLDRMVAISWSICKARNDKLWKNKNPNVNRIITEGVNLLEAWSKAQVKHGSAESGRNQTEAVKWNKPDSGWTKVNTDAAVFTGYGGIRAVFRNEWGSFVGGFTQQIQHITDAQVLEVIVIREVLNWLKEKPLQCID